MQEAQAPLAVPQREAARIQAEGFSRLDLTAVSSQVPPSLATLMEDPFSSRFLIGRRAKKVCTFGLQVYKNGPNLK